MKLLHHSVVALSFVTFFVSSAKAKAEANHCGDHIGFGPAPCLDSNIQSNEFTEFMHHECYNAQRDGNPTLCDQYNPVWGQVHFTYQNKGDGARCDLSKCKGILFVHPVFKEPFNEGETLHEIAGFTHCTQDECALDAADATTATECWNTFSGCFPSRIGSGDGKYHVVVEQGTDFDNESKLSEHYIYGSLPFAPTKATDPKCDACNDCREGCEKTVSSDVGSDDEASTAVGGLAIDQNINAEVADIADESDAAAIISAGCGTSTSTITVVGVIIISSAVTLLL